MYTVFIALQDIEEDMGATIFLPRTNSRDSHTQHKGSKKDIFLAGCEYRQGLLKKGDLTVMDSRILHCGDSNYSKRRVLLYFTLKNPLYEQLPSDPVIPSGSKWSNLHLTLKDCGFLTS